MGEMTKIPVVTTSCHFGGNYTAGIMVQKINRGIIFAPWQNSTNIHRDSITTSTKAITIVTIVKGEKMPEGVGWIAK